MKAAATKFGKKKIPVSLTGDVFSALLNSLSKDGMIEIIMGGLKKLPSRLGQITISSTNYRSRPRKKLVIFVIFLGIASSYDQFQNKLILKEAFLVSLFLTGLVILGGQQKWWLQPLLNKLSPDQIYYAATALTAITDNAALTYLGSLVEGVDDQFKYALVAGAVTGGGLTVIANAPNPAGFAILQKYFNDGSINAGKLLIAALGLSFAQALPFLFLHFFFHPLG